MKEIVGNQNLISSDNLQIIDKCWGLKVIAEVLDTPRGVLEGRAGLADIVALIAATRARAAVPSVQTLLGVIESHSKDPTGKIRNLRNRLGLYFIFEPNRRGFFLS